MKVEDYKVGWICALPTEMAAATCMLDELHEKLPQPATDANSYTLGRIAQHNVVIACLPAGVIGVTSAARVTEHMRTTFTSLRFGLLVGIGGGVPSHQHDIRLGDVVVSKPGEISGGVIQYDFGKTVQQGRFVRTGSLNRPPDVLLNAVANLQARYMYEDSDIPQLLANSVTRYPHRQQACTYPGFDTDKLFHWEYDHSPQHLTCAECDTTRLIGRSVRSSCGPNVHYGLIASGGQVMRDGVTRERLRKELDVLCFEMEAAGLMDSFSCLVVRGISDYADSHKSKQWQDYAANTAAAYAKELLKIIPRQDVEKQMRLIDVVEVSQLSELIDAKLNLRGENLEMDRQSKLMHRLSEVNLWGKQVDLLARAHKGTGRWILEEPAFKSWLTGSPCLLLCQGDPGVGKTILSSIIIEHLCSTVRSKTTGVAWLYIDYREHDLQTMENLFANLLVQLFTIRGEVSQSVRNSLGLSWEGAKPTAMDYKSWLQEEVRKFDQMIVIVDALDELPSKYFCEQFINELQSLKPPIRLLATSRPMMDLGLLQGPRIEIDLHPRKADVISYVEGRLQNSEQLWNHVEAEPSLRELTMEMLTAANDRMFLRAQLILNILEHLESATALREALTTLPSTYDGCYEFSLKQIEMKDLPQREIAFTVLAWLSHALGSLTVKALQDALSVESVEPRDRRVMMKKKKMQISEEDLISSCSGLVIIEIVNGIKHIRLLHETARAFLKGFQAPGFPSGHELILRTCLAYLSLPEFSDLCIFRTSVEARARRFPFFEYAARYWSAHTLQGKLELAFQDAIVNFIESSQRYSADELLSSGLRSAWGCDHATPWTDWNRHSISRRDTPIHAAANYGLSTILRFLIKEKGYAQDRRNNFGETALHRAAQLRKTETREVLIASGADLEAKVQHHYLNEATPFILATICRQAETVRVLLNHGVDPNTFDPKYRTFPLHLAASMDTKLTRLLLDHGAHVNFPGKSPIYPETWPMTPLHFAVFNAHAFQGALDRVRLLLDRGAMINVQSSAGNTALHMAILAGHQEITNVLLRAGSDNLVQNKSGKSVVQLARERGHLNWIGDAVPKDVFEKFQAGPVLHQAIWSGNYSLVLTLLESGHDIAAPDYEGVTPWEYCISSSNVELAKIFVYYMDKHKDKEPYFSQVGDAAFDVALSRMTAFDYTDHDSWANTVHIATLLLPFRRIHDHNFDFVRAESPICGYKKTYLIWAAELGRLLQVRFLLQCGSNVNAQDMFGATGLNYAINNQNIDMVRLLVEEGRCDVTLANGHGITPLIAAERTGNILLRDYIRTALPGQSQLLSS